MAFIKMTDNAYWDSPGRFAELDRVIPTVRHTYFTLGDARQEQGPVVLVMDMQPGHVVNSHAHASGVFEVVVKGSIEVNGQHYGPGDVMVLATGEQCGRAVAGPEGCTTVEFFTTFQGAHQLIYRGSDGQRIEWDSLAEHGRPETARLQPPSR